MNTFVPIILLFYLGLLSLVFDVKFGLEASLGSLSTLVIYRYFLASMSPKTSYSTTLDNIYVLILSLSFLVFIFHVYDLVQKKCGIRSKLFFLYVSNNSCAWMLGFVKNQRYFKKNFFLLFPEAYMER